MARRRSIVVVAAVAALAMAGPAGAGAVSVPVAKSGGTAQLTLDVGTVAALKRDGVRIVAAGATRGAGSTSVFRVTGGTLADSARGRGEFTAVGRLLVRARGRVAVLTEPGLVVGKTGGLLSVRVDGGKRVRLLTLDVRRGRVVRDGATVTLSDVPVKLASTGARALNAALGAPLLAKNTRLGTIALEVTATQAVIASGTTTLALADSAAASLTAAQVTVAALSPATRSGASITLPATGGLIATKGLLGAVNHGGGIELTRAGERVRITTIQLKLDAKPNVFVRVNGTVLDLATFDPAKARITSKGTTYTLTLPELTLTDAGASGLNAALGADVFSAGDAFATPTLALVAR